MTKSNPNAFDYVFRVEMGLTEETAPKSVELGALVRTVDHKTFIFETRGETRRVLGRETTIRMLRVNPPESDWPMSFAARRAETTARLYAWLYLLGAKTIRVKPLYRDDEGKWVAALEVDSRDLSDILRERGFAG